MNGASYLLGVLLFIKLFLRFSNTRVCRLDEKPSRTYKFWIWASAGLTVLILLWCLVHALNARANYVVDERKFYYQEILEWLPHSYSSSHSWFYFWTYLGVALSFWAVRDWILGIPLHERSRKLATPRINKLLWLISINATILAIECILQRLEGSGKLLFLIQPKINYRAEAQFGPYAYRSNAAQYFNLIWPLTLAFWYVLKNAASPHRNERVGGRPHLLLFPGIILMAASPIISLSRGGALVSLLLMGIASILFVFFDQKKSFLHRLSILLVVFSILGLAKLISWELLKPRLESMMQGEMSDREETYSNAIKMVEDFFWFGSGPGTFDPLYQLYLSTPKEIWYGQLHNDWLETLITFGLIGSLLLLGWLVLICFRWFIPKGITWPRLGYVLPISGITGCLLHAIVDFPLQIHSVLFAFMLNCVVLSVCSRSSQP